MSSTDTLSIGMKTVDVSIIYRVLHEMVPSECVRNAKSARKSTKDGPNNLSWTLILTEQMSLPSRVDSNVPPTLEFQKKRYQTKRQNRVF